MNNIPLDTSWLLVCASLVLLMQAGFLCLESGLTRSKNAINVAAKNLSDFSLSMILFWVFGYALMFGVSDSAWIGGTDFFYSAMSKSGLEVSSFIFQAMFCATAATIVSGAVAERTKYGGYLLMVVIVSGVIYPVFGHWCWGGTLGGTSGWLRQLGFVDFAGSSVVHMVGGCAALAGAIVIGPRIHRFEEGKARRLSSSNLQFAMLGALLLFVGWIGFNGGSASVYDPAIPRIVLTTLLAGVTGMCGSLALTLAMHKGPDVMSMINGTLGGLVAITACCHAIDTPQAVFVGMVGGALTFLAGVLVDRCKIDDAVGAFSVHGAAGAWGTIAVGLFGDMAILGTGLTRFQQIGVQSIGVLAGGSLAFGGSFVLFKMVNRFYRLRVSAEAEERGLNIVEHGVSTDAMDLLAEMEHHRRTGRFHQPVTVEAFSEVGSIAVQYNRVIHTVHEKTAEAEAARRDLQSTVDELEQFNNASIGRELRMVELKEEVNQLCAAIGSEPPYASDIESVKEQRRESAAIEEGTENEC